MRKVSIIIPVYGVEKYIDNNGYIYRSNRIGSTMNSSHKELDLYSYNQISEKNNEYLKTMKDCQKFLN